MGCGLPGHLFQTYASYKLGTREIVQWLCQSTGNSFGSCHVDSIWELEHLSKVAVQKHIQVSPKILRTLRRTIKARKKLGAYFESTSDLKQQEANSTHSHFTRVLLAIYHRLSIDVAPPTQRKNIPLESSNPFDGLDCDELNDESTTTVYKDENVTNASAHSPPIQSSDIRGVGSHDIISEFMALSMYLSQLEKLFSIVQNAWQSAADGAMPLVVASFTASICYQSAQPLRPYLTEYSITDPEILLDRYSSCAYRLEAESSRLGCSACSLPNLEYVPFAKADELQVSWCALRDFRQSWKARATASRIEEFCTHPAKFVSLRPPCDDVRKLFPTTGTDERSKGQSKWRLSTRQYMDIILERMGQQIGLQSKENAHISCHTPLLGELKTFLQSNCDASVDKISLSFGLLLMLESLGSYYVPAEQDYFPLSAMHSRPASHKWNSPPSEANERLVQPLPISRQDAYASPPSSPEGSLVGTKHENKLWPVANCRISSLSFARYLKLGIERLLKDPNAPCGCLHIRKIKVLGLIANYHSLLTDFTEVRNFDLFHQAPWVSGMDMLQNLMYASDCGLKSWHHGYFVGTMMHIYNTLIQLGVLDRAKIPLMESLCLTFSDVVFLGHRPRRNLWSCYQRWCGARLNFAGKKCEDMHTHTQPASRSVKKWKMESVHDVSQGGDDPKRSFAPGKVSVLASAMNRNTITDDDLLLRIYNPTKAEKPSRSDIQKARNLLKRQPFISQHILHVQELVLAEFRDESPIAKLDYFRLYEKSCEILRRISAVDHAVQEPGHICSRTLRCLLYEADQYLDHEQPMKRLHERCIVNAAVEAFQEVLGESTLLDFTWRI